VKFSGEDSRWGMMNLKQAGDQDDDAIDQEDDADKNQTGSILPSGGSSAPTATR